MKPKKNFQLKPEAVIINKNTNIETFTPEEEVKYLIERGDWELLLTSPAFKKRTPEGQAQLISTAIDNRIGQLNKTLNYLVNRGPDYHSAATGVVQRLHELRIIRDRILKKIYEQFPKVLDKDTGRRIKF